MRVGALYSFNGGLAAAEKSYPHLYEQVVGAISTVSANTHSIKLSKEETVPGQKLLYSAPSIKRALAGYLLARGWQKRQVPVVHRTEYYLKGYVPTAEAESVFREMDLVKEKFGAEVQFGKHAATVYSGCAKMTIFHNLGIINAGIEIVPVEGFARQMPSRVPYFERFIWDLEHRGVGDIDVPALILGVDQ